MISLLNCGEHVHVELTWTSGHMTDIINDSEGSVY